MSRLPSSLELVLKWCYRGLSQSRTTRYAVGRSGPRTDPPPVSTRSGGAFRKGSKARSSLMVRVTRLGESSDAAAFPLVLLMTERVRRLREMLAIGFIAEHGCF